MVTYMCRNCNFKYSPKVPRMEPPKRCHNCGGMGTVEREPDADQIIKESNIF